MSIGTGLFRLPGIILIFFCPQFEANRRYHVGVGSKRWAWIVRPLSPNAAQWLLSFKTEIFLRWIILAGPVSYLAVLIGPPAGAFVYLIFYALASWTLLGLAVTYSRNRKHTGA